jgi:hypothetical protein
MKTLPNLDCRLPIDQEKSRLWNADFGFELQQAIFQTGNRQLAIGNHRPT